MIGLVALAALAAACGSEGEPEGDATPCRYSCQSNAATCSNACDGDGPCQTACANNELTCLKVCEAEFPTDDPTRCNYDCDRFGAECRNNCTDDGCRMACTSSVNSCKAQCYALYP